MLYSAPTPTAVTKKLPNLKWFLLLSCAITMLLAACSTQANRLPQSPVEAVRQMIPRNARKSRIFGTSTAPSGETAVIFEYRQPQTGNQSRDEYILGFSLVSWGADSGWQANHTFLSGRDLVGDLETPIAYEVYQDGFTAVYGPLGSPQVRFVEAAFANGEKIRQQIDADYFLIFSPLKVDVCELVFYSQGEEILERKSPPRQREYSDTCP